MEHVNIPSGEVHTPYNWVFADDAEMLSADTTDATLVDKVAVRLSDMTQWMLTSANPPVWRQVLGLSATDKTKLDGPTVQAYNAIGGHRVICLIGGNTEYADCTQVGHAAFVIGVTTSAVQAGAAVSYTQTGEITEPSWSWTLGQPVYLGANGTLTQTLPVNAVFSLVVGFPVAATKLFVSIREPIILS